MTTHHGRAALVAEARKNATIAREDFEVSGSLRHVRASAAADLLDRLATALEESARDTERLNWLERTAFVLSRYGAGRADIDVHPALDSIARETVREAIDAARARAAVPDEAAGGRTLAHAVDDAENLRDREEEG